MTDCPPQPCTGVPWSESQKTKANKAALEELSLNTLYRIVVRSILGNHRSGWSGPVYTYTTIGPLSPTRSVANFRFNGYWKPPVYKYIFCSDTVPTTTTMAAATVPTAVLDWEAGIGDGIATWKTATEGAVTMLHTAEDCDTNNSGSIEDTEQTGNLVWIASDDYVRSFCNVKGLGACVIPYTSGDQLSRTPLVIGRGLETVVNPSSSCSAVSNAAVHEAGHALGIRGHNPLGIRSVMTAPLCVPQQYDIVAIKALYQSQNTERQ